MPGVSGPPTSAPQPPPSSAEEPCHPPRLKPVFQAIGRTLVVAEPVSNRAVGLTQAPYLPSSRPITATVTQAASPDLRQPAGPAVTGIGGTSAAPAHGGGVPYSWKVQSHPIRWQRSPVA